MSTEEQFSPLISFRQAAYGCLGTAQDALFELADAVLLTPWATSFAALSLCPAFRRGWPSVYEALEDSRPDRAGLLQLYVSQMPEEDRPLLVGDHPPWPRLSAKTLRDRTCVHQPTRIRGNKPITLGHDYSTIAWMAPDEGRRAIPLLHERITSEETPMEKGAAQLRLACAQLKGRPLSLWDSEYGCASFLHATAQIDADKLMRVRPNRCLYGPPPPPLEQWWHLYGRRGPIEPWYHLAKSRLYWTLPRLKTPEQNQRWSDLMPLLTWQL